MDRHVVIGTAGHIDHGKTALVQALTGVDTDRWAEEKRRGITIDLGFAPLALDAEVQASIVDVPGHEGFVRNMLAGATGIDIALLVIAADEGIMPQTEEHLAILELLGVRRGVPVMTKCDLVEKEWLQLVRAELADRLAASPVRWAPAVETSAVTGEGLETLRAALRSAALEVGTRSADDLFRLPIDRVFTVAGAGTVITGTTWSGSVAVSDAVRLLPRGLDARVRSIEVHGRPAERAVPGRRTALALAGVDRAQLTRGDVAVTGPGWAATAALDVAVDLLPTARRAIKSRTRVRVHLGTAEVLARIGQVAELRPGESGRARLLLEGPLLARGGDRFVIRSYSPVTTIGGGVVLDPFPPARPRVTERRLTARQSPSDRLLAWTEEAGLPGVPVAQLAVRLGVVPGDVSQIIDAAGARVLTSGDALVSREAAGAAVARLRAVLAHHHQEHPLDPGMSLQALRGALTQGTPNAIGDAVMALGVQGKAFEIQGSLASLPGWAPRLDGAAGDALRGLSQRLEQARWNIPTVAELEREFSGVPVRALLAQLLREGLLEQVDQERYGHKGALQEFRGALEAALSETAGATPAQLRGRFGLSRKYLIPLLEWADRRGITRRVGDARMLARLTGGTKSP